LEADFLGANRSISWNHPLLRSVHRSELWGACPLCNAAFIIDTTSKNTQTVFESLTLLANLLLGSNWIFMFGSFVINTTSLHCGMLDAIRNLYEHCKGLGKHIVYAFIRQHPSYCTSTYLMDYYFASLRLPL